MDDDPELPTVPRIESATFKLKQAVAMGNLHYRALADLVHGGASWGQVVQAAHESSGYDPSTTMLLARHAWLIAKAGDVVDLIDGGLLVEPKSLSEN